MKLHSAPATASNTVTAYGEGYIEVNRVRYDHAVAFGPEGDIRHWPPASAEAIDAAALEQALALCTDPEILLVGTGVRQRFLAPALLRPHLRAGVGVEMMDSQAAARTYNILMAEGRRVVAALIPS